MNASGGSSRPMFDPRVSRHRITVDVSSVGPPGAGHVVADVLVSKLIVQDPSLARAIAVCLPGGGMDRTYFDLRAAGTGDGYSMAAYLAARGVVVVTLDHPAVGESDVPDDPYLLSPRVVSDINAYASEYLVRAVREGGLGHELPAFGALRAVGVGHSMGGLLTVHQQASHHTYDGLALLGFAGGGLLDHLNDEERSFMNDPDGAAANIARLAAKRFGRPLSRGSTGPSPFLLAVDIPDNARAAIGACGANLLNLCGLFSMLPGVSQPQLHAIDVPVFLGVAEHDITGPAQAIPAQFPTSRDITLFVLPNAGHNHNVAPTRTLLWQRIVTWLDALIAIRRSEDSYARSA